MPNDTPNATEKEGPDRGRMVDEHFWFTATTLAVNAFIISECSKLAPVPLLCARVGATILSAFAAFLIVHRSASHAGVLKNWYPTRLCCLKREDRKFWHKAWET